MARGGSPPTPARPCGTGIPPTRRTCPKRTAGMPSGLRRGSPTGPARPARPPPRLVAKILESRPHPEQGYRAALGIIRLAGRYGDDRAEAACARALRLRSYSYRSVESILRTGLDRQPLPGDKPALPPHPAHQNVRGPGYYH